MTSHSILVADHEPAISDVLRVCLEVEGYGVTVVNSSEQALKQGTSLRPQLLLIDPVMPGMSGVEVATRLSRETSCKVLFVTAFADDADFKEMVRGLLQQGCDAGILPKPFEKPQLLESVRRKIGVPQKNTNEGRDVSQGSEAAHNRNAPSAQGQPAAPYENLLEFAAVNLYQRNAFRITGLNIDASLREVSKEAEKLEMMLKLGRTPAGAGIFPLPEPPTVESVRNALQALKNPESRLVQELFWFWPCTGDCGNDPAMGALRQGHYQTAVDCWTNTKDAGNGIAIHNLAVFYHLGALDSAVRRSKTLQPTTPEEMSLWSSAYRYWNALLDRVDFWDALAARIRTINDPRLRIETSQRIWGTLPNAIVRINAELAVSAAERGDFEEAAKHRKLMYTSAFGEGPAKEETRRALSHAKDELEQLCENAEKAGRSNPKDANLVARKLLDEKSRLLRAFNYMLGAGDPMRDAANDRVAEAGRSCIVAYVNETEDWAGARSVAEECLALAEGKALRLKLEEDLDIIGRNLIGQQQSQSPPQSNRTSAVDATPRTGEAGPTPAADIAVTPPGYMLVQASDGGLHHIPIANIDKARTIDPKLTILHVEPARTNQSAAPQTSTTAHNTRSSAPRVPDKAWNKNKIIAAIFVVAVILVVAAKGCDDSNTPVQPASSQGSTQATPLEPASQPKSVYTDYSAQQRPSPFVGDTTSLDALKGEIEADKRTLDLLEGEVKSLQSNVDEHDSLLKRDKSTLDQMKRDNDAGIEVDESLYETTRHRYNANVSMYNSLLSEFKAKAAKYNQLLASTNAKIDRYNAQGGTR
jgi:CheY-like chemotaxis protein